jgi:hypothetical protein
MAKLLLSIAVISALIVCSYSATCGSAPWFTALDEKFGALESTKLKSEDAQLKTWYSDLKARTAAPIQANSANVPSYCATWFTDVTKNTCCNIDSKKLINAYLRNTVNQGIALKKQDRCASNGN